MSSIVSPPDIDSDWPIEACPYCQVQGDNLMLMANGVVAYWVVCIACKAAGPTVGERQDAIDEWNTIAGLVKRARELERE